MKEYARGKLKGKHEGLPKGKKPAHDDSGGVLGEVNKFINLSLIKSFQANHAYFRV